MYYDYINKNGKMQSTNGDIKRSVYEKAIRIWDGMDEHPYKLMMEFAEILATLWCENGEKDLPPGKIHPAINVVINKLIDRYGCTFNSDITAHIQYCREKAEEIPPNTLRQPSIECSRNATDAYWEWLGLERKCNRDDSKEKSSNPIKRKSYISPRPLNYIVVFHEFNHRDGFNNPSYYEVNDRGFVDRPDLIHFPSERWRVTSICEIERYSSDTCDVTIYKLPESKIPGHVLDAMKYNGDFDGAYITYNKKDLSFIDVEPLVFFRPEFDKYVTYELTDECAYELQKLKLQLMQLER
jgi:hypothetical protein